MPTLLETGKIIKQKWMSSAMKRKIDSLSGIDFLLEFISDRMWLDKNIAPKIKLRHIGDKVIIIKSGTGSGKSTILPSFLYRQFYKYNHKTILIAQATKAATVDIPYQIIKYNSDFHIGDNIGFQTGSIVWKPVKGLLFTTIGILLQYLKIMTDEQFMHKYSIIIIDEVHERSLEIDTTLFYLKKLLERNWDKPECPLIILMSATLDPQLFMQYFKCPSSHFLQIEGESYPIKEHYTDLDISDYLKYAIELIKKIHLQNINDIRDNNILRDILIFVQGKKQINYLVEGIHKLNYALYLDNHNDYLLPIPIMSINISKGSLEYKMLFSDINNLLVSIYKYDDNSDNHSTNHSDKCSTKHSDNHPKLIKTAEVGRRVLIGTNAIETGITIDTLKYCIDTGFVKQNLFDPNFGCHVLIDKNVTQSSVAQRKGRVGRKGPGEFYALYTKKIYQSMPPINLPDIIKEDISKFLLSVIIDKTETTLEQVDQGHKNSFQMNQFDQNWYILTRNNVFQANYLDFIQYPSYDSLAYSLEKLHVLGFIDHEYNPTLFGYFSVKLRKIRLESIRMILAGYHYGANILDLITISSFLEVGILLGLNRQTYKPRDILNLGETEAYYYYRLMFMDDFIEYLFIWNDFMKTIDKVGDQLEKKSEISLNYLNKWADSNNLKLDGLYAVIEKRDSILIDMLTMGLNPYYNGLALSRGSYNLVNILKQNLEDGLEEIKKIKHCIYEGYRLNLCIWNNISQSYIHQISHNKITLDNKLLKPFKKKLFNNQIQQEMPQKIIIDQIIFRQNPKNKDCFEFISDNVSVLDGFVEIDQQFIYH